MQNNKQNVRRGLSAAVMTFAMAVSCISPALAAGSNAATDYDSHWAQSYMQQFVDEGYLSGYGNGVYKPDAQITRAEFIRLLNRVQGLTEQADKSVVEKYTDVVEGEWYYNEIAIALDAGYVSGREADEMAPNGLISREEAMTMIGRLLYGADYNGSTEALSKYSDGSDVSGYAKSFVAALTEAGIVAGSNGKVNPADTLTRAEAVKILVCAEEQLGVTYVMMNVPYSDFYAAVGDDGVDAVSSATMSKSQGGLAAGSYHVEDGSEITGITYPVKIAKAALAGQQEITEADSYDVTSKGRDGTETTTTYSGLFKAPSYSYMQLDEEPEYYLTASIENDGSYSFSKVQGEITEVTDAELTFTTDTNYGDYQLNVDGELPFTYGEDTVYAVTVNTTDGAVYGLGHVQNIWRGTMLGWSTGHQTTAHGCTLNYEDYADMEGKTISGVTYYTSKGNFTFTAENPFYVAPYADDASAVLYENEIDLYNLPEDIVNATATVTYSELREGETRPTTVTFAENLPVENGVVTLPEAVAADTQYTIKVSSDNYAVISRTATLGSTYLLVNIPYADFYAAEGDDNVDAVSSATLAKTRTGTLAGGSYHVNADGSDITGITYPVKVSTDDLEAVESALEQLGGKEITAADSVTIETTNRGNTSTATFTGADALFEAPSYSWILSSTVPSASKTATVDEAGKVTFSAVNEEVTVVEDVQASFSSESSYGDYQLDLAADALPFTFGTDTIYGVALKTSDGAVYGLRHVENIWRGTSLAWSVGHTTNVHGCTLNTADYADMEGKTLTSVVYYTSKGTYELKLAEAAVMVPYYTGEVTAEVTPAAVAVSGLPEDIENAQVSVSYQEGRSTTTLLAATAYNGEALKLTMAAEVDKEYTVKITSDNYAVISTKATCAEAAAEPEEPAEPETKTVTLTGTATTQPDEYKDFDPYEITVNLAVENDTITGITMSGVSGSNQRYADKALNGISSQVVGKTVSEVSIDAVAGATCSSKAITAAIQSAK